jgi:hypothetical protein
MENEVIAPIKVTIDISCLDTNELTADLYVLLHNKHFGNYELPKRIKESLLEDDQALEYLQSLGFIKILDNNDFDLRQSGINLFVSTNNDEKWLEFLGTFPLKVPARNNGTRALKVANPDSPANSKIKAKYISIIKNDPNKHSLIMKVLNAEMKMRKDSGNLPYMNAMEAWLNQANYDKYMYLLDEAKDNNYETEDYM